MDSKLTNIFWTQAGHTTIHIQNRVTLINNNDKSLRTMERKHIQQPLHQGSWKSGLISRNTKGITCLSSKDDFQISQRNIRFWIMVSKRKGSITYCLHRCRLGRLYWWSMKHQWSTVLLGWVFNIMSKKEKIISISIYNRGKVYCSSSMMYIGSLDETNSNRYTGWVWWAHSNLFW